MAETGTGTAAVDTVLALPYRKNRLHEVQGLPHGTGARKRAVVMPLFGFLPPDAGNSGMPAAGHQNVGIGLVIPKQNVVTGLIFLDKVAFQDQSFGFGKGNGVFDMINGGHQFSGLQAVHILPEIGGKALLQIPGLSDVDNNILTVKHPVHAAPVRHLFQKCCAVKGHAVPRCPAGGRKIFRPPWYPIAEAK